MAEWSHSQIKAYAVKYDLDLSDEHYAHTVEKKKHSVISKDVTGVKKVEKN